MKARAALALFVMLLLVACGRGNVAPGNPNSGLVPVNVEETATSVPATPTITSSPTSTDTPTPTLSPTPTPEPKGYGPKDFPDNVNPLTGLEVKDSAILARHPIGIKVNIVPRYNRPPWGLSFADIVYDYYHNDGYTRYHAIFYGQDAEMVGPIRSGRLLDEALLRMYKSIFAYGSADQLINNRLLNSPGANRLIIEGRRSVCPPTGTNPMCRYEPNSGDYLLGGTEELTEYMITRGISAERQELDGMTFHPVAPPDGDTVEQVFVRFSADNYNRWDYDPTSGRYLLFQDNLYLDKGQDEVFVPLIDRLTEKQLAADNVVILVASHEYFQRPPADIVEISLFGTGQAYAFRNGKMYEVSWNRPTLDSVLYLTFDDGSQYPFKPGSTWFQVIGRTSEIMEQDDNSWRFNFRFP